MSDDFTALTGRCMCGAVEISTAAPFIGALYCHCKRCQRRSGTTRSMTALCPPGAFSVAAGEDKVQVWDPGDGWLKAFCVKCGSHTHTVSPDDPTLVAIRLGCLDQDAGIRPQVHQFVAYASSLEPLPDDGLPRFPERFGATDPALSSAKGSSATPPATFAADGAGEVQKGAAAPTWLRGSPNTPARSCSR
jgi:hypothetical protein